MTLAAGREWGAELEEDVFDESCPLTDLLLLDELLDPHAAGAGPAGGGAAAGAGAGGVGGGAAGPFGALPPGGDASTLFTFPPGFGGEAVATGHVIPDTDPAYGLLMGGGRVGGEGDAAAAAAAAPAGAAGGGGGAADDSGCAAAAAATQPEGAKRQRGGTRSTSLMRGVTHHWRAGRGTDYFRTGRWEAHLWSAGKQVYLGGFDTEQQAALAYDLAVVRARGAAAQTNYSIARYAAELANLQAVTQEELVLSLRRQSKGFSRGSSAFRGVTRHAKSKWEARIGALLGRKYKYLGLFSSEEQAARAYDEEARGLKAVTNFPLSDYAALLGAQAAGLGAAAAQQPPAPAAPSRSVTAAASATATAAAAAAAGEARDSSASARPLGPAVHQEPSPAALAMVQNLFARVPEMAAERDAAAAAAAAGASAPAEQPPRREGAPKRPRRGEAPELRAAAAAAAGGAGGAESGGGAAAAAAIAKPASVPLLRVPLRGGVVTRRASY